jgi:hypothetical protein
MHVEVQILTGRCKTTQTGRRLGSNSALILYIQKIPVGVGRDVVPGFARAANSLCVAIIMTGQQNFA